MLEVGVFVTMARTVDSFGNKTCVLGKEASKALNASTARNFGAWKKQEEQEKHAQKEERRTLLRHRRLHSIETQKVYFCLFAG